MEFDEEGAYASCGNIGGFFGLLQGVSRTRANDALEGKYSSM